MTPFYEWGSTASRLQPLPEGFLIFTTKFPGIHGNQGIEIDTLNMTLTLTSKKKKKEKIQNIAAALYLNNFVVLGPMLAS